MAEWEDRTAKERQERNNAASLKDTEMKQEAESGLAKFHADRKTTNASAETKNVADEQAAAEALANETNPWNTVFSMCADPSLPGPTPPPLFCAVEILLLSRALVGAEPLVSCKIV